jgi:hypothetical protein
VHERLVAFATGGSIVALPKPVIIAPGPIPEEVTMMKYKLFGTSGLRVAELSLGTLTFGTEMGWGEDKTESRRVFDAYAEAGGNFLDTANKYMIAQRFGGTEERVENHRPLSHLRPMR